MQYSFMVELKVNCYRLSSLALNTNKNFPYPMPVHIFPGISDSTRACHVPVAWLYRAKAGFDSQGKTLLLVNIFARQQ